MDKIDNSDWLGEIIWDLSQIQKSIFEDTYRQEDMDKATKQLGKFSKHMKGENY